MPVTADDVLQALTRVRYPGFTRDLVAFGVVRDLAVDGGHVRFRIELGPGNPAVAGTIEREARAAVAALPGVASISLRVDGGAPTIADAARPVEPPRRSPPGSSPGSGMWSRWPRGRGGSGSRRSR